MMKLTYFTLIFAVISTIAVAAPYQELAPRAGHVPVYIREGNTPLSEIHPKLVEAFPDDESVRNQLENKTPEAVPEAKDDNEENTKKADNKDEIVKVDDVTVDEVTASDIAEFDAKLDGMELEPEKVESPVEDNIE